MLGVSSQVFVGACSLCFEFNTRAQFNSIQFNSIAHTDLAKFTKLGLTRCVTVMVLAVMLMYRLGKI